MRKKWENPVINILGVRKTEDFRVQCMGGYYDISGTSYTECKHEDGKFKTFPGDINENTKQMVDESPWAIAHLLKCKGPMLVENGGGFNWLWHYANANS